MNQKGNAGLEELVQVVDVVSGRHSPHFTVRTVLPFHVTSRGRPTLTESNRGIHTSWKSSIWLGPFIFVHLASFCIGNVQGTGIDLLQSITSVTCQRASNLH